MSIRRYALVLGLIALCQGCDLAVNFTRNVIFEVQRCTDDCREHIRNRRLANLAWNEAQDCVPMGPFRPDYARGFKDGYADYLYAGGECDPPFLPPRHYWGMRYETPQGFQAIQDWYAGYRHGRAAAQLSGYRQFVMIPFPMSEPGLRTHSCLPRLERGDLGEGLAPNAFWACAMIVPEQKDRPMDRFFRENLLISENSHEWPLLWLNAAIANSLGWTPCALTT